MIEAQVTKRLGLVVQDEENGMIHVLKGIGPGSGARFGDEISFTMPDDSPWAQPHTYTGKIVGMYLKAEVAKADY